MASSQQSTTPLSSNIETVSYVSGMVEAFRAFDSDNDGLITEEELRALMGSLGYDANDREAREMMRQGDGFGDGLLSAREFLEMVTDSIELDAGELAGLLEAALSALDTTTTTTTVTGDELFEVLSGMGSLSVKDCMDIVASLDGDGDGEVNLQDLNLIVQALL